MYRISIADLFVESIAISTKIRSSPISNFLQSYLLSPSPPPPSELLSALLQHLCLSPYALQIYVLYLLNTEEPMKNTYYRRYYCGEYAKRNYIVNIFFHRAFGRNTYHYAGYNTNRKYRKHKTAQFSISTCP